MGVLKCFSRNTILFIVLYIYKNYISLKSSTISNHTIIISDLYNPSKSKRTNQFNTNVTTNKKQSTFHTYILRVLIIYQRVQDI